LLLHTPLVPCSSGHYPAPLLLHTPLVPCRNSHPVYYVSVTLFAQHVMRLLGRLILLKIATMH
jgi:hypothetical protein